VSDALVPAGALVKKEEEVSRETFIRSVGSVTAEKHRTIHP